MKVFRIRVDVNRFQSVFFDDPQAWSLEEKTFDARPRLTDWSPPDVFVLHPKYERGDFFGFDSTGGAVAIPASTRDKIADLLEMSGECLPIRCGDEELYLVNVLECINVLDERKSKRDVYPDGSPGRILEFAFHPNQFTETPLFKIPETCKSTILTVEGMKDPDDEFKGRVERLGLKGLVFEPLWSDE